MTWTHAVVVLREAAVGHGGADGGLVMGHHVHHHRDGGRARAQGVGAGPLRSLIVAVGLSLEDGFCHAPVIIADN